LLLLVVVVRASCAMPAGRPPRSSSPAGRVERGSIRGRPEGVPSQTTHTLLLLLLLLLP